MKILIKNGQVVNYDGIQKADVLIQNDSIVEVGSKITTKADKEIDAKGKYIFPGFIDLHVHLRTPGREDEEDFLTGSQAAVKGGFTTIFCMPNTEPAIDNEALAKWVFEESKKIGLTEIIPIAAITKGRKGTELTEFNVLKKIGCLAVSDDGDTLADSLLLRRALEYAKMSDLLIISHCEDKRLVDKGVMRESGIASKYGIASIPDISESIIVARDIELAKYLDARIHIAHVSTAKSLAIIEKAKMDGVRVTCETAPHYFILTVEDLEKRNFDSNLKVNPPIGTKDDLKKIKDCLAKGIIDCIATDHAPHSAAEKELPFSEAPFGFIGLEFSFALSYTYLVKEGVLDLPQLAKKLSFMPAQIMKLEDRGKIEKGYKANLVIVDLTKKQKIEELTIASKSKNTPFLNYEPNGIVETTIFKGKIVYSAKS